MLAHSSHPLHFSHPASLRSPDRSLLLDDARSPGLTCNPNRTLQHVELDQPTQVNGLNLLQQGVKRGQRWTASGERSAAAAVVACGGCGGGGGVAAVATFLDAMSVMMR